MTIFFCLRFLRKDLTCSFHRIRRSDHAEIYAETIPGSQDHNGNWPGDWETTQAGYTPSQGRKNSLGEIAQITNFGKTILFRIKNSVRDNDEIAFSSAVRSICQQDFPRDDKKLQE